MGRLESVVDFYVDKKFVNNFTTEADEKDFIKKWLIDDIIKEVKQRMTDEELEVLKEKLHQEEVRLRTKQISKFIIEAIFVAFIVGMITNQATNFISEICMHQNWNQLFVSLLFIAIFLLIMVLF